MPYITYIFNLVKVFAKRYVNLENLIIFHNRKYSIGSENLSDWYSHTVK